MKGGKTGPHNLEPLVIPRPEPTKEVLPIRNKRILIGPNKHLSRIASTVIKEEEMRKHARCSVMLAG